jgi:hypothetical protein
MIFAADLADKILAGKKTVTRRPRKVDPWTAGTGPGGGGRAEPCRYQVGRTYSIQPGRGKKGVGRIRILSVRMENLCDMDNHEARLEGFGTLRDFENRWLTLYPGAHWLDPVWRIEFALVPAAAEGGRQ